MSQLTTDKKKAKEISTLDVQNKIYKRCLETYKLRQGKTFDELLKMANDPRRYSRVRVKKSKR